MRIRTTILTGALLLASAPFLMAQQSQSTTQPGQTTDVVAAPQFGNLDFGFRTADITGDSARFQRYQDVRDKGAGLNVNFNREGAGWFTKLDGKKIGYDDQEMSALFGSGKIKASVDWNQTPLYYGAENLMKTPYRSSIANGVATLSLDSATRVAIENGTAIGIPVNVGQLGSSAYLAELSGIDLRSHRNDVKVGFSYAASRDVDVKFGVNTFQRTGTQPWGASFAFNDAVELPLPLDNRTTDLNAGVEWSNQKGMLRFAYDGSYFTNNIETLVWSNPFHATDSTASNAYSNGAAAGAANGRMALSPSNHSNTVSAGGLLKLPAHSSVNAAFSIGSLRQNEALIPAGNNSVIENPVLPRSTADADVRVTTTNINFSSRPNRYFGVTAKYRYYNYDNRTPVFYTATNVRFDGVLEDAPFESEYSSLKRQNFDLNASFTPSAYGTFRVGYGREAADQTYRMIPSYSQNTYRLSYDTVGNQYVMLRATYEKSNRSGAVDEEILIEAGQQPAMAQFDVANRNRDRGTFVVDVTPVDQVAFSVTAFKGRDKYPDQEFGLLNNNNSGVMFGVDLMPREQVTLSFNYGYEKYSGLQASRNANPAPDPSWTDPARNWNLDNSEKVNSFGVYLDLIKVIAKTDLRFGYGYDKSDQAFAYSGPRIETLTLAGTFLPLPDVWNREQRATADVRYFVSPRVALGATYLFDKFDVVDFATPNTSSGGVAYTPLGGLILGYGDRPFKANVGSFRVIYVF
jgi:MtrB/PioB family decaheme-associated outer membrane protein